jgi:hypothetical protein
MTAIFPSSLPIVFSLVGIFCITRYGIGRWQY